LPSVVNVVLVELRGLVGLLYREDNAHKVKSFAVSIHNDLD